ncbi:MAG: hypothetical protein ACI8UO_003629 [Verrucomicrobiales bacterium]|jgi:hypothetical protein
MRQDMLTARLADLTSIANRSFVGSEFTFIVVQGGDYGLAPHQEAATKLIRALVESF